MAARDGEQSTSAFGDEASQPVVLLVVERRGRQAADDDHVVPVKGFEGAREAVGQLVRVRRSLAVGLARCGAKPGDEFDIVVFGRGPANELELPAWFPFQVQHAVTLTVDIE